MTQAVQQAFSSKLNPSPLHSEAKKKKKKKMKGTDRRKKKPENVFLLLCAETQSLVHDRQELYH
jgi:hypothetical protein